MHLCTKKTANMHLKYALKMYNMTFGTWIVQLIWKQKYKNSLIRYLLYKNLKITN